MNFFDQNVALLRQSAQAMLFEDGLGLFTMMLSFFVLEGDLVVLGMVLCGLLLILIVVFLEFYSALKAFNVQKAAKSAIFGHLDT